MRLPSGDQTGETAGAPNVRRVRTLRESKIQMPGSPVEGSLIAAAMRLPSGARARAWYSAGSPNGSPRGLPEPSYQRRREVASAEPAAYTSTPLSDAEKLPRKNPGTYWTPSA